MTDFLEQVYKKEDRAYETCCRYLEQKIKYATILLSFSGIEKLYKMSMNNIKNVGIFKFGTENIGISEVENIGIFILLVPLVVYTFDPLVLQENRNIRIIGEFLSKQSIPHAEEWNNLWGKKKWKKLFLWGSYSVSILAFLISVFIYWAFYGSDSIFLIWSCSNIVILIVIAILYKFL